MTTTVMRGSIVGDRWIYDMCQQNPTQWITNEKGERTGDLLTGPVRLTFCDALFTAKPGMRSKPESETNPKKFGTGVLWPPYVDLAPFWEAYYAVAAKDFADLYNPGTQQYYGLDNPIYDQGSKMKYDGYTAGCQAMNTTSQFKPPIVDSRGNPLTDESKVYAGVWAILAVNPYASGKNAPRKGPRFGLQMVMIVGEDKPIAGGGVMDPKTAMKQIKVAAPAVINAAAFAAKPPGAPGAPPMGAYYPPPAPGGAGVHMPPPPPGAAPDDDMSQFV